eukprot:2653119-Prymnesium_polylepis.2
MLHREDGALMTLVELTLILTYICVLLIKTCNESVAVCTTYGLGDNGQGGVSRSFCRYSCCPCRVAPDLGAYPSQK